LAAPAPGINSTETTAPPEQNETSQNSFQDERRSER